MIKVFKAFALGLSLLLATVSVCSAQDFQKGLEAYEKNDNTTALREFRPLAAQGEARAQYYLGMMYRFGLGVPKDKSEAIKWFRLAADAGNVYAQSILGFMYADGEGVPKNDAEAVKWYRLAADQGQDLAQYVLGRMYDNGEGVPKNAVQAYKWWNLAAAQGHELAKKHRDLAAGAMTREQIAEAQKLSAEWKQKK